MLIRGEFGNNTPLPYRERVLETKSLLSPNHVCVDFLCMPSLIQNELEPNNANCMEFEDCWNIMFFGSVASNELFLLQVLATPLPAFM